MQVFDDECSLGFRECYVFISSRRICSLFAVFRVCLSSGVKSLSASDTSLKGPDPSPLELLEGELYWIL